MPYISINDDLLHFTDDGVGVPIVFVHGSCGGAGQWKSLASKLQQNYRTVCIDLLGSGRSEPWSIERQWSVRDDEMSINAVLDTLAEPVHLIVHSGGGVFSYPTIQSRRDQILSLTMFEPVFFHLLRQNNDPNFSEPEQMAKHYRATIDRNDRDGAMRGFVDAWARNEGAWASLPDPVRNMMLSGADRLYYEWLTPWLESPSRADLTELDLPVLLFKGSSTIRSMHRVCEILREALPFCQYIEVNGAGHMCPFTHADAIAADIVSHLTGAKRELPDLIHAPAAQTNVLATSVMSQLGQPGKGSRRA